MNINVTNSTEHYDFDKPIERYHTNSEKYDGCESRFGKADLTPLWVADMDFAAPEAVLQAMINRAAHPIYGYTFYPDSIFQSIIDWFWQRHQWKIEKDWILMMPGVVPSMHLACLSLVDAKDAIIVQPPVYYPCMSSVEITGRTLMLNPLQLNQNQYHINFAEFEQQAAQAKMLIFCSPHNPVGRVWQKDELRQLLSIAQKHKLLIFSDEIHADLIFPGNKHLPLGTLIDEFGDYLQNHLITAVAPSKTFNIPGLGLSCLIVPNAEHRKALNHQLKITHMGNQNPFSMTGWVAAYTNGQPWLDALLNYLQDNKKFITQFLAEHIPQISVCESQGTYLMWLDCRGMALSDTDLHKFFVEKCELALSPGTHFGRDGSGFMRLNIGTRRQVLMDALQKIKDNLT
jgi:cysteine-S-conjugate beta-lyase